MNKKKYLWAGLLVVLAVAIFLIATGFLKEDPVAYTPPITNAAGDEVPGSIAVIETVVLGGVEQTKERVREGRHGVSMESLARDLRYAMRSLGQARGFSLAVVGSLSLGLAATIVAFAFINGALFG